MATPSVGDHVVSAGDLAGRILAAAQEAGLSAGGRLPTERQLALQHGVSRASVRNALALLELNGVVVRQVGRGTFIASRENGQAPETGREIPLTDLSPADVMAVRVLLEPPAMALVVARATTRDIAEMERCLVAGDRASNFSDFERWDSALHRALFQGTHNPLLIHMYEALETAKHGPLWGALKVGHDSPENRARYQRQHREVVNAVRDRHGDAATAAMQAHLADVSATVFGPLG